MTDETSLLIVCLGNICRSPMAEGALRARLGEAGLGHVRVDSAGTGDWHVGNPPDSRAIATAARHGVDISGLRARQLHVDDYRRFDWILAADLQNLLDVRARAPEHASARIELLTRWVGLEADVDVGAIPDPYTGGQEDFEHVWRMVDDVARATVARLRAAIDA